MKLFSWLTGWLSHRDRATSLYRRGMAKAKLHDHKSAIADYTIVISMVDAPSDLRAMALYNRSHASSAGHDHSAAIGDLEKLLKMPGAAANVKTEARRKLMRVRRTSDRLDERPSTRES